MTESLEELKKRPIEKDQISLQLSDSNESPPSAAYLCDTVSHGGGRASFAGGGCGHCGGCLHDRGGHIGQRGGGGGVCSEHGGHVTHQPQVALGLDVGVALCRQFEHLQAIVVQA